MNDQHLSCLFVEVASTVEKRCCLAHLGRLSFLSSSPLLFVVAGEREAHYLDTLLWSYPEESLLPHIIANRASKELIVISWSDENHNKASVMVNLRPSAITPKAPCRLLIEFKDSSSPERSELSRQKQIGYQQENITISTISWNQLSGCKTPGELLPSKETLLRENPHD